LELLAGSNDPLASLRQLVLNVAGQGRTVERHPAITGDDHIADHRACQIVGVTFRGYA
jgi:hypothetical protein